MDSKAIAGELCDGVGVAERRCKEVIDVLSKEIVVRGDSRPLASMSEEKLGQLEEAVECLELVADRIAKALTVKGAFDSQTLTIIRLGMMSPQRFAGTLLTAEALGGDEGRTGSLVGTGLMLSGAAALTRRLLDDAKARKVETKDRAGRN
jgi:hypothetical protein